MYDTIIKCEGFWIDEKRYWQNNCQVREVEEDYQSQNYIWIDKANLAKRWATLLHWFKESMSIFNAIWENCFFFWKRSNCIQIDWMNYTAQAWLKMASLKSSRVGKSTTNAKTNTRLFWVEEPNLVLHYCFFKRINALNSAINAYNNMLE